MKRSLISIIAVICLLLPLVMCSSCQSGPQKFSTYSFDYFDTVTTIVGYAESEEEFNAVCDEILELLKEYHKLFTIYSRYEGLENLCTINELVNGSHREVTVDRRIVDMLLFAKEMYKLTDGRVNIAMGSVLSIWHDYRTAGMDDPSSASLPPIEKLKEAANHTDIDKLIIDEQNNTVFLSDPEMRLDVGAIAKGYTVEEIARSLEEKNISGYVLNVGGNVRTVGAKADGSPWIVGVENSKQDGEGFLAYLGLTTESLVTSGSYQRYYVVDGERYHHIIDPETLYPSEGYLSVSVVVNDSGLGDALSTALFCMDFESGQALIESIPDAEALWVFTDGTQRTTSGFDKYTTND